MASNVHQRFMVPKYQHLSMDSSQSKSANRSVESTISLRQLKAHDRKLQIVEDLMQGLLP